MLSENKIVVAVKGIIIGNGKAFIIKRSDDDETGAGTWEFPGGKIGFGENLEAALIREVREESGPNISVSKILYATTFKTDPTRQVVILTYLCESLEEGVRLSPEHTDYQWVTNEQLKQFLPKSIVKDLADSKVLELEELL